LGYTKHIKLYVRQLTWDDVRLPVGG